MHFSSRVVGELDIHKVVDSCPELCVLSPQPLPFTHKILSNLKFNPKPYHVNLSELSQNLVPARGEVIRKPVTVVPDFIYVPNVLVAEKLTKSLQHFSYSQLVCSSP